MDGGSASAKDPRFQDVNVCLGNLKSAITGTYRHFNFAKHAPRYCAGFQFRSNRRKHLRAMLGRLIRAPVQRPPSPRRSFCEFEVCCYSGHPKALRLAADDRGHRGVKITP